MWKINSYIGVLYSGITNVVCLIYGVVIFLIAFINSKFTTNSHADPSNFEPDYVHPTPTLGSKSTLSPYKYGNPLLHFLKGPAPLIWELFFPKKIKIIHSTFLLFFLISKPHLQKLNFRSKRRNYGRFQENYFFFFFKEIIIIKEQWIHNKMCFFGKGTKGKNLYPPPLRHHALLLVHSRRWLIHLQIKLNPNFYNIIYIIISKLLLYIGLVNVTLDQSVTRIMDGGYFVHQRLECTGSIVQFWYSIRKSRK